MINEKNHDPLDVVFDRAISGNIILKNPNILNSDYIPEKLPFRDKQIIAIGQTLAPLLKGSRCSNLLLYGKTGTGKTVVSHYVINRLTEKSSHTNNKIRLAYTNTRVSGTGYRVLSDLASAVDLDIPFTGLAIGEVLKRIINIISKNEYFVVFILDEIDYLVKTYGDNILYEITRSINSLHPGFISIIGISNDLQFKEYLDPRVLSSLGEEEIVFPPYTAEEIKSILEQRAIMAFEENSFSLGAINLCAALAGSEHGDARRAVDLLRVSAEISDREGANKLDEKHVRIALQKMERDRIYDALNSLPLQAKVLLLSILYSDNNCSTGQVYEKYELICKKTGIEILTQRRISGLLSELDLLGLISTNVISTGRYGRTKKIKSLISIEIVKEVFTKDTVLSSIIQ
jgi:cell division control protein 6